MKISIKFEIGKELLVWAAYMQIGEKKPSRLSKQAVLTYLKEQIFMFGIDDESLMGSNYVRERDDDDLDDNPDYQNAIQWVEKNFKGSI